MQKYIKHLFFLFFPISHFFIIGCSRTDYGDSNNNDYILENAEQILLGMERKEVIGILGSPSTSYYKKKIVEETFFYNIPPRRFTDELNNRPTCFIIVICSNKVVHAGMMWAR